MAWEGERLKDIARERRVSLSGLASSLNVSRQSVNDWIKGQVPRGTHLIDLSRVFGVSANYFFSDQRASYISIPLHRKRGVAKITPLMKKDAFELADQYEKLFRWAPNPGLVQTLRADPKDRQNAIALASKLRKMAGIESHKPMDYQHTFKLLSLLSIIPIFRYFPKTVKDYAFYSKIHKHRVVFVNNDTNILDLIFPLLHETVHAVNDGEEANFSGHIEDFCDLVANHTQFPKDYVLSVFNAIKGRSKAAQIKLLKDYSAENSHSMFGIVEMLKDFMFGVNLEVGGANANLRKMFPTIGDILFKDENPRVYIERLATLSPLFVGIVSKQMDKVTTMKVGEWLGLESSLDAKQAIEELKQIASSTDS